MRVPAPKEIPLSSVETELALEEESLSEIAAKWDVSTLVAEELTGMSSDGGLL